MLMRPFVMSLFLIISGIAIAFIPGQHWYEKNKIEEHGITTQAIVGKDTYEPGRDRYTVTLRFATKTKMMIVDKFETSDSYWDYLRAEDEIEVRYSRDNPRKYYVPGVEDNNVIFVILGGLLALCGLFIFLGCVKRVIWEIALLD